MSFYLYPDHLHAEPHHRGRPPVLIILHQEHSTPGRIAHALTRRGFGLDIRRPRFGDPLPTTLNKHAGAIVFGGPMSANDPDDFVRREIDWHAVPLKESKPYLGVCLGAQMLAKYLGARVDSHRAGLVEIGYYPLTPTPRGVRLLQWPSHVYQWHREGFDLPAGATRLASSEMYENQAFQIGKVAYGLQFHPELTHAMMVRWTTKAAERMTLPGARRRHAHFEGRLMYDTQTRVWLEAFLDRWIGHAHDHIHVLEHKHAARTAA